MMMELGKGSEPIVMMVVDGDGCQNIAQQGEGVRATVPIDRCGLLWARPTR
jgi:hypothetical protein